MTTDPEDRGQGTTFMKNWEPPLLGCPVLAMLRGSRLVGDPATGYIVFCIYLILFVVCTHHDSSCIYRIIYILYTYYIHIQ